MNIKIELKKDLKFKRGGVGTVTFLLFTLFSGFSISGCAPFRLYDGPALPKKERVILESGTNYSFFGGDEDYIIEYVDGISYSRLSYEVKPGVHLLNISYHKDDFNTIEFTEDTCVIKIITQPGKKYRSWGSTSDESWACWIEDKEQNLITQIGAFLNNPPNILAPIPKIVSLEKKTRRGLSIYFENSVENKMGSYRAGFINGFKKTFREVYFPQDWKNRTSTIPELYVKFDDDILESKQTEEITIPLYWEFHNGNKVIKTGEIGILISKNRKPDERLRTFIENAVEAIYSSLNNTDIVNLGKMEN